MSRLLGMIRARPWLVAVLAGAAGVAAALGLIGEETLDAVLDALTGPA